VKSKYQEFIKKLENIWYYRFKNITTSFDVCNKMKSNTAKFEISGIIFISRSCFIGTFLIKRLKQAIDILSNRKTCFNKIRKVTIPVRIVPSKIQQFLQLAAAAQRCFDSHARWKLTSQIAEGSTLQGSMMLPPERE